MPTMDNLGWIALGLALLLAVGAVIMQPIYEKAKEQKEEIENFKFDSPSGSLNMDQKYEVAMLEVKDDNFRENILAADMAYNA